MDFSASKHRDEEFRGPYTLPLWAAMVLSLPFFSCGAYLLGQAAGAFSYRYFVAFDSLIVFGGFGLSFVFLALLAALPSVIAASRRQRFRQTAAGDKWRHDFRWKTWGIASDRYRRFLNAFSRSTLLATSLLPALAARALYPDFDYPLFFSEAIVTMALFTVAITMYSIGLELRLRHWGAARLSFKTPPYPPGREFEVHFWGTKKLADVSEVHVCLRSVREVLKPKDADSKRLWLNREETVYQESVFSLGKEFDAKIVFSLPQDAPTTELSAPFPTYWELVVKAELPKRIWTSTFLVPVYSAAEEG